MALNKWDALSADLRDIEDNKYLRQQMEKMVLSTRRLIDLMERTHYRITQVNGQRTYGPPPYWSGDPPGKDCEVFVGRIPRDCFEDELIPVLELAGFIYEFRLMMDFSGSNRGFGFALYSNQSEARQAIEKLNQYEIRRGCTLGIVKSMNNCKLFIGGLDVDVSEEELIDTLNSLTGGVSRVTVHPSRSSSFQRPKKYAIVEYETHRAAAMARRVLVPQKMRFRGMKVVVDWANPFGEEQKWEKKLFQGTSPKQKDKRNNSIDTKSKVVKTDGKSKTNDRGPLAPRQARMVQLKETPAEVRDRNVKEAFCDTLPEYIQNDQIPPLNIGFTNFQRLDPMAEFKNLNNTPVGNLTLGNQNSNSLLLIPQSAIPAANFALQHIMFTACQAQMFGFYQETHPAHYPNLVKESLMLGDKSYVQTPTFLCKQ